jgi:hypothetical protein
LERKRCEWLSTLKRPDFSVNPGLLIQGEPPWGEGFAGVIIQAVSGDAVWTVEDEDKKVGKGWRRGEAIFWSYSISRA